ncbi:unnamed protein product [Vitrella brassicaformis CCMP3155]|uniref:RING-type domain-containing protein n=1 Tax=Vitrella brassicaformis (strain CCMP3155) TaxID=1169540 RepID=A0A0G4GZ19_VITBC|nr:unnamed protein product [Vitrella brassicaformis CCMP3155]|eukprot:CEM36446.1 unnamed protein product [Vitrella brassicaformis CCMP3155]
MSGLQQPPIGGIPQPPIYELLTAAHHGGLTSCRQTHHHSDWRVVRTASDASLLRAMDLPSAIDRNLLSRHGALCALDRQIVGPLEELEAEQKRIDASYDVHELLSLYGASDGSAASGDDQLDLNVGGRPFTVRRKHLTRAAGSVMASLFGGRWDHRLPTDDDNRFFIDADPRAFERMLSEMRWVEGEEGVDLLKSKAQAGLFTGGVCDWIRFWLSPPAAADGEAADGHTDVDPPSHHTAAAFYGEPAPPQLEAVQLPEQLKGLMSVMQRIAQTFAARLAELESERAAKKARYAQMIREIKAVAPFLRPLSGDESVRSIRVSTGDGRPDVVISTTQSTLQETTSSLRNRFDSYSAPVVCVSADHFSEIVDYARRRRILPEGTPVAQPTTTSDKMDQLLLECDMYGLLSDVYPPILTDDDMHNLAKAITYNQPAHLHRLFTCVSTADQTPREERLPGPSAGSKLGRGRRLGLSAAAPSLLPRPVPHPPCLPSAEELCESGKRRSFVSSSPSHPPPPPRPLPPAHRPASGADDPFPPLAHEPQQLDGSFPSSSSGHRPSCHRGPPPLVNYPKSAFDACPSSSSYDHPTAAPAAPVAAAAFATPSAPYEEPLGPSHDHEGDQGASAAGGGGDSVGVSSREAELQRKNDELARRLAETERGLAQMSIQQHHPQHQPSSSSSSSAPLPLQQPPQQQQPPAAAQPEGDGHECAICLDAPPSVMYMPCRHLRLCRQCYDDRCSKWRRDLQQVRAENARRREENDGIKRQNEGRKKKIPLVELLDEPEYLCEQCKTKVVFAGSRDEVRQWADQPIT